MEPVIYTRHSAKNRTHVRKTIVSQMLHVINLNMFNRNTFRLVLFLYVFLNYENKTTT